MKKLPIAFAVLAAVCYGISAPAAKILLEGMPPALMAAMLYLGAGIGMLAVNLFKSKHDDAKEARVTRNELPYTIAMVGVGA